MISYPRDLAGHSVPVQVINRPVVVDGADAFVVTVHTHVGVHMETWTLDTIRRFVADGEPITLSA